MTPRRLLTATAAGVLALGICAGCSSDSSDKKSDSSSKVDGSKVALPDNDNSVGIAQKQLPASFPKDAVPLPDDATLTAAISGQREGNGFYSLTYAISGDDVKSATESYRDKLKDAGYRVQASTSVGQNDAAFSSFTAVGPEWYVIAYGGGSHAAAGTLTLQVTKQAGTTSSTTGQ